MAILTRLAAVVFALVLLLGTVSAQADSDELVRQAADAYDAGHYAQAVELYEKLLDDGFRSFALYFNLGNAYFESGQIGKALVNYLRAEAINPRDGDLDRNMARVRTERVTFQRDEHNMIDRIASMSAGSVTMREQGLMGFVTWGLFFGILVIYLSWSQWRRRLLYAVMALGIVAALANGILFARIYATNQRPPAVVTNLLAMVYSGPSFDYLEIYDLHMATELRIVEQRGVWVKFVLPDGRQGWVNIAEVEKI